MPAKDQDPQEIARAAAQAMRERIEAQVDRPEETVKCAPLPAVPVVEVVHQSSTEDGDPEATRRIELLSVLAASSGNLTTATRVLAGRGVVISKGELSVLREQNSGVYAVLADEEARAVEEGMAQAYREIAHLGQRFTRGVLVKLNDDMDEGRLPRDLDRSLTAAVKAMSTATDKLLTITGRPVSGAASSDPMEALKQLEKLGVARMLERPEDDHIPDAEVVA